MKMRTIAWSMVMAGLMATSALAQTTAGPAASAPQSPAPPPVPSESAAAKRYTITTGVDFTSAYLFRGIRQHSGGTIAQPTFDLGFALGRGASFNVGNWDSVHTTGPAGNWYESDYYTTVNFTAGKLKPGVLYTQYTSPSDAFSTVKELAGVLALDDSGSAFPLSPKAILAMELGSDETFLSNRGQADGGTKRGVYLELGIKPGVKLAPKATLYIPIKTGLSLKDYYEGPVTNDHFGYLSTGVQLSVPVVSGSGGTLEAHGGLDVVTLGENLKAINGGDKVRPVGTVGFTFTY
jgi:hypothetical protein